MKLTNTYISDDCTRKVLMYVDKNGHYEIHKKQLKNDGWELTTYRVYKHFHSAERASLKFIQ
jgi:transcription initiation factor IIE alpha subunit